MCEQGFGIMKKLLMATDLSARSDRALERAVLLAKEKNAQLTIVHIVDEDLPPMIADIQKSSADVAIRDHLKSISGSEDLNISIETGFGRVTPDILTFSQKVGAELIILGLHRNVTHINMFRGTTTERVIRSSQIPVLLVKERATAPYGKVLVGVDFSIYSKRAIEFASTFVPNGDHYLVHAYDVPFKGFLYGEDSREEVRDQHQAEMRSMIEDEMESFLARDPSDGPKLEPILQEGTVREVIRGQVTRLKPDLLVIGTHGRTGVARAFLGSVAEDFLSQPPCDVLAVKAW